MSGLAHMSSFRTTRRPPANNSLQRTAGSHLVIYPVVSLLVPICPPPLKSSVGRLPFMELTSPIWNLKSPRCPCCEGEGALCFSSCPSCGCVVLVCDEVGSVFPNLQDLTRAACGAVDDGSVLCPSCEQTAVSDFRHSTSEEVQRLGFGVGEYE